jgi:hypothetical protein
MLKSLLTLFILSTCATLVAEERDRRATITIGDSITAALAVLRECRIKFHHGGLTLHIPDADSDYFVCYPDENRTHVMLSFSKSRGKIRGMTAITIPHRQSGRSEHIWTEIRGLTLGKDKSYSIEFLPTKPRPPGPAPKDEIPGAEHFSRPPLTTRPPGGDPFAAPPVSGPPPSSVAPKSK